jgi:hypothetical protein
MIQLRLSVQAVSSDVRTLRTDHEEARRVMATNHAQNRTSIHDLKDDLQTMADNVSHVSAKIDNYLLVQKTREEDSDKAWWKQPLGTAVIVSVISAILAFTEHQLGWLVK